jgi:protocatechuate 3,4-dioxygenase beta subunit
MTMSRERPSQPQEQSQPGNNSGRREFIHRALLATASTLAAPAFLLAHGRGAPGDCGPTTDDIPGPFYQPDAPLRVALAANDEPGTYLFMKGKVYARDCTTPIPGATVDVWHASDSGCYSDATSCQGPHNDRYNLRGRMLSDAEGFYSYSTIIPGRYLNGSTYRPSHIHYKVTPPGGVELVTQLYFEGDPYLATDPWASDPKAAGRIITLQALKNGFGGDFDIVLDVDPATLGVHEPSSPRDLLLDRNYPNPFTSETVISYHVPSMSKVELAIFNTLGQPVRVLTSSVHAPGVYAIKWDGLDEAGQSAPAGGYFYRLRSEGGVRTRHMMLER